MNALRFDWLPPLSSNVMDERAQLIVDALLENYQPGRGVLSKEKEKATEQNQEGSGPNYICAKPPKKKTVSPLRRRCPKLVGRHGERREPRDGGGGGGGMRG